MMPKGSRFTIHGSISDQLLAFFENNPDEELTMKDIQEKFGSSERNAYTSVERNNHVLEYAKVVRLKSKGVAQ